MPPVISDNEDSDDQLSQRQSSQEPVTQSTSKQAAEQTQENNNEEEEEGDDLFGDDSEEEKEEGTSTYPTKSHGIDAADSEEDAEEPQQQNSDENESDSDDENIQRAELTLPRHPKSHEQQGDAFSFNLPRFLFVDSEPFSPSNFETQLKDFVAENNKAVSTANKELQDSIEFKKLEIQNTIRWRYAKTESDELYKQSNANIIEWDDGSMSLKIGKEFFDIKPKQNEDNILAFQGGQVLVAATNLNKAIQVLPSSMNSKAHRILATTLQSNLKMRKSKKINTIVTKEDPELKAREFEKAQREIERARRRQIAKLQQEEERLERKAGSPGLSSRSGSRRGGAGGIDLGSGDEDDEAMEDGYDEQDDFVVSDDEEDSGLDDDELDEAAEKLRKLKRDGAAKYKRSDEQGEEDKEEDDDDDEEGAVVRKKRRIVLDDDEDEDE